MPSGRINVVLLCEDAEHRSFFLSLCREFGFQAVRVVAAPSGVHKGPQGCAFVQKRYAGELSGSRRPGATRLIAVIDGDRFGVAARLALLDATCSAAGVVPRNDDDRAAVCVPTYSIETWEMWLCGNDAEEETDYSERSEYDRLCKADQVSAARAARAWSRGPRIGEPARIPSLVAGRAEMMRLFDRR
jgi:hypothetical protein